MFGYLAGKILEAQGGRILLGVGAASDVGYLIGVPQHAAYQDLRVGQPLSLFIHTHVREDALDLFGFISQGEKNRFLLLIGISGVGPKLALPILSGATPERLIRMIIDGDAAALQSLQGIGKKTAERLVVELREVLKKKTDAGTLSAQRIFQGVVERNVVREAKNHARDALRALGYKDPQIESVLENQVQTRSEQVEDWVREALKHLGM